MWPPIDLSRIVFPFFHSTSTRERIFPHRLPCHVDSFSAFGYDWVVFVPTQPFSTTTAKVHRPFVGYFAPFRYCVPFFTCGKQLVNGFGIRFVLVLSKDGGSFIQYPFGFDRVVPSSPCSQYRAVQAQHSSFGYMYVAGHCVVRCGGSIIGRQGSLQQGSAFGFELYLQRAGIERL